MKILFLTSRLPYPPHRGDRIRTFHFLRRLARDHEVHLISFIETREEERYFPILEQFSRVDTVLLPKENSFRNMIRGIPSSLPLQLHYYRSVEMEALVRQRSEATRFDLVYTHLFRMAPFAVLVDGAIRVLDLTDCVSRELGGSISYRPLWMRLPLRMETARIRLYEKEVTADFDEVWTISESDRDEIAAGAPGARIHVVPNGVSQELFDVRTDRKSPILGFLGNYQVPHNIDAARILALRVMPIVRSRFADAQLHLIGHGHSRAVDRLDGFNGTVVVGPIDNWADALSPLSVFVAPLRYAAGVQNKIVEAMAAGLPVVTSSPGNCGLQARSGSEILVYDSLEEFAVATGDLLRDPNRAAAIGERGRAFVRSRFSWDRVAERVGELLASRSVLGGPGLPEGTGG
ncbi:MAG: glycosyltransferase [Candidatus Eisenbacteria bacterium]|nr:glycosyltransferase [Candidatus Eisenbacteria bacterium]